MLPECDAHESFVELITCCHSALQLKLLTRCLCTLQTNCINLCCEKAMLQRKHTENPVTAFTMSTPSHMPYAPALFRNAPVYCTGQIVVMSNGATAAEAGVHQLFVSNAPVRP